jgi:cbb3-type cytochrome oxidase maturation protein
MLVIFLLIFVSLTLATVFLACFIWAVRSGQFEDTCTPSMRILADEEFAKAKPLSKSNT